MKLNRFLESYEIRESCFETIKPLQEIITKREIISIGRELKEYIDRRFPEYRKLLKNSQISKGLFAETIYDFYKSLFSRETLILMVNSILKLHEKRGINIVDFLEVYSLFVEKLLTLLFCRLDKKDKQIYKTASKLLFAIGEYILNIRKEELKLIERDPITGVFPRYKITSFFEKYREEKDHYGFIVDIRNFGNINTVLGYEAGDSILVFVSNLLKENLGQNSGENVFRLQGDQFFVFVKGKNSDSIKAQLESVVDYAKKHSPTVHFQGKSRKVQIPLICVGAKLEESCEYSCFMWTLENALKEYKKLKKTGVYLLDEKVKNQCFIQRENIKQVIEAIEEKRITFALQKIFDISEKQIFGYEALARLINKHGDIVSASVFFNNLNAYSLDEEIDMIVIDKVFHFKSRAGIKENISVNVSNTLLEGNLNFLITTADKYNINPKEIVIELTERQNLSLISNLEEKIEYLKEAGFKIFIDDFGVDYANFHLLEKIKVDGVKIDGKFIRDININPIDREFVSFVLSIARTLNIHVVAEYVENREILKTLEELSSDQKVKVLGQGYLFGKPEVKT
ncbi:EAL domain-containing protein [Desulfurobacterium atlanticum]|uniref:Diguanylate cyclase (GGDEF) domain-containing protein n=1 Tax=Desulfurobacterium atlanticum TaxID=240169 RepID=A0A238Y7B5_9BACT|nr:GGDEF domain-containing phosphodiesterase [Desulfurobacterium atlanticum]SNR66842.1 diguanylate cyclase (GGDEF) domain-containing protein [Desulfurobacterium atlanticum]